MTSVKGPRAVRGPDRIETSKRGFWLLKNPSTNKDLGFTQEERDGLGALFPDPSELREISAKVAVAVLRYAGGNRLGRPIPDADIEEVVRASMWFPEYVPTVPRGGRSREVNPLRLRECCPSPEAPRMLFHQCLPKGVGGHGGGR